MCFSFSGRDDPDFVFGLFCVDGIEDASQGKTQIDESFFAVIEPVIYPDIPVRIFKGWDCLGEGETMLAPVGDIFRRSPDVARGIMVRLSRSQVKCA